MCKAYSLEKFLSRERRALPYASMYKAFSLGSACINRKRVAMKKIFLTIGGLLLAFVSHVVYWLGRSGLEPGFSLDYVRGGVVALFIFFAPVLIIAVAVLVKKRICPRYETCLVLVLCIIIGALLVELDNLAYDFRYAKSVLDKEGIDVFWDK